MLPIGGCQSTSEPKGEFYLPEAGASASTFSPKSAYRNLGRGRQMRRREFITLLRGGEAGISVSWLRVACAQQPAMAVVGISYFESGKRYPRTFGGVPSRSERDEGDCLRSSKGPFAFQKRGVCISIAGLFRQTTNSRDLWESGQPEV
jgi:hypothetical protein